MDPAVCISSLFLLHFNYVSINFIYQKRPVFIPGKAAEFKKALGALPPLDPAEEAKFNAQLDKHIADGGKLDDDAEFDAILGPLDQQNKKD